jgi:hypothetical protein
MAAWLRLLNKLLKKPIGYPIILSIVEGCVRPISRQRTDQQRAKREAQRVLALGY